MTPWRVSIPPESFKNLVQGYIPRDMDDKWFIYADGFTTAGKCSVHMIRSWTGARMIQLDIDIGDAMSGMGPAWVETLIYDLQPLADLFSDASELQQLVRGVLSSYFQVSLGPDQTALAV